MQRHRKRYINEKIFCKICIFWVCLGILGLPLFCCYSFIIWSTRCAKKLNFIILSVQFTCSGKNEIYWLQMMMVQIIFFGFVHWPLAESSMHPKALDLEGSNCLPCIIIIGFTACSGFFCSILSMTSGFCMVNRSSFISSRVSSE